VDTYVLYRVHGPRFPSSRKLSETRSGWLAYVHREIPRRAPLLLFFSSPSSLRLGGGRAVVPSRDALDRADGSKKKRRSRDFLLLRARFYEILPRICSSKRLEKGQDRECKTEGHPRHSTATWIQGYVNSAFEDWHGSLAHTGTN